MRIGKTTHVLQQLTRNFVWRMDDVRFGKPFGGMPTAMYYPYSIWYQSVGVFLVALRPLSIFQSISSYINSYRPQVAKLLDRFRRAMLFRDRCLATRTSSGTSDWKLPHFQSRNFSVTLSSFLANWLVSWQLSVQLDNNDSFYQINHVTQTKQQ